MRKISLLLELLQIKKYLTKYTVFRAMIGLVFLKLMMFNIFNFMFIFVSYGKSVG